MPVVRSRKERFVRCRFTYGTIFGATGGNLGIRVGIGHDTHRLIAGGPLRLGGVDVPFDRQLDGHSDADVLLHAITDALLGAAGLGDIGELFPNTDEANRDRDSAEMLSVRGRGNQALGVFGWQSGLRCFCSGTETKRLQTADKRTSRHDPGPCVKPGEHQSQDGRVGGASGPWRGDHGRMHSAD